MSKYLKKKIMILCITLFILTGILFTPVFVNAGVTKKILVNDMFDSNIINTDSWQYNENKGITLDNANSRILKFQNAQYSTSLMTDKKMSGSGAVFEFDIVDLKLNGGWIGITYGANINTGGAADEATKLNSQFIYLFEDKLVLHSQNSSKDTISIVDSNSNPFPSPGLGMYSYKLPTSNSRLKITCGSDGSFKLEAGTINKAGNTVLNTICQSLSGKGFIQKYSGGYAGILLCNGKSGVDLSIDNVKIYTPKQSNNGQDKIFAQTDFENGKSDGFIINNSSPIPYSISKPSQIIFDNVSETETFIMKNKISYDNSIKDIFDVSFGISIKETAVGKKIGVMFGLKEKVNKLGDEGVNFVYLVNRNINGKISTFIGAETYVAGKAVSILTEKSLNRDISYKAGSSVLYNIQMTATSDMKVSLSLPQLSMNLGFSCKKIDGYIGIAQIGQPKTSAIFNIDNVKVINTIYDRPKTKSLAINFDNTYYNPADYYIVSGTYSKGKGSIGISDGVLKFDKVIEGSIFAPRYPYSNFELTFDITKIQGDIITNAAGEKVFPPSSWIGITFGRKKVETPYYDQANGAKMIYFERAVDPITFKKDNHKTYISSIGLKTADNNTSVELKDDFWDAKFINSRKINVKIIAKDGTVSVYYKFGNEPISVLDVPVVKFVNVDTSGYLGIVTTGSDGLKGPIWSLGQFEIDNFSITNTDVLPAIADEIQPVKPTSAASSQTAKSERPLKISVEGSSNILTDIIVGIIAFLLGCVFLFVLLIILLRKVKFKKLRKIFGWSYEKTV